MSRLFRWTVSLVFILCSLTIVSLAGEEGAPNLSVESVVVTKATGCSYRWDATVKNNGVVSVNGSGITAYQGNNGGSWQPASGTSFGILGPNQTVTKGISFVRKANKNQLSVRIYYQGAVIAEKIVELPPLAQPSFEIFNCNLTSNGLTVNVRNLLSESVSDFTVQTYVASAANPNSWVPSAGMGVDCLAPNAIYQHSGPRPAGFELVKVMVFQGGATIIEKVFNLSTQSSGGSNQQVPIINRDKSGIISLENRNDKKRPLGSHR